MLKIATASINTTITTTKGTLLFPLEWGGIEALQAHTNLCLINLLKKSSYWKLLQLQSTQQQQQQQQKGHFCFHWNEEGLKLFKLIKNNLEKFDGGWVGGWERERERERGAGGKSTTLFCFLSLLQSVFSATTFVWFYFCFYFPPFLQSVCAINQFWPIPLLL
jgi:hypothetical protein